MLSHASVYSKVTGNVSATFVFGCMKAPVWSFGIFTVIYCPNSCPWSGHRYMINAYSFHNLHFLVFCTQYIMTKGKFMIYGVVYGKKSYTEIN